MTPELESKIQDEALGGGGAGNVCYDPVTENAWFFQRIEKRPVWLRHREMMRKYFEKRWRGKIVTM